MKYQNVGAFFECVEEWRGSSQSAGWGFVAEPGQQYKINSGGVKL